MTNRECLLRLLCDALVVLALPADDQIRTEAPGCAVCDMLENFDHAYKCVTSDPSDLSARQRNSIDLINATMDAMNRADMDCNNAGASELLSRPVWQVLREMAAAALHEFGWQDVRVTPHVEVKPGYWNRPLAELPPQG